MHPIPGVVEKKVAQSLGTWIRNRFNRYRDQEKRIESLEAQPVEARSGTLAFEKELAELVCRPEDDHMYSKKDGSGGPYCPLCIHADKRLIPLIHGFEGSFYCRLHEQFFETQERRTRRSNYVPRPRSWRAIRERLEAESYRQARKNGAG
jgi:hypothetical protein